MLMNKDNNYTQIKNKNTIFLGILGILSVTAIWGCAFVFMKNALDYISSLWFLGIRFSMGAVLLWLIAGKAVRTLDKQKLKAGFLTALPLWAAYLTQTIGLTRTTVSNSAFITGTYVVFVSPYRLVCHPPHKKKVSWPWPF